MSVLKNRHFIMRWLRTFASHQVTAFCQHKKSRPHDAAG